MNSTDDLPKLPICIPTVSENLAYSHHPISQGDEPDFYKPGDLRDIGEGKTARGDFFEKILVGLYWKLGAPVPYAFRTHDGKIRSLDAGCLKFLANRSPADVTFHCDTYGYIDSIEPSERLLALYGPLKSKLMAQLDIPSGS